MRIEEERLLPANYGMIEVEKKALDTIEFHVIGDMKDFLDEVAYLKRKHFETITAGPSTINLNEDYYTLVRKYSLASNSALYASIDREIPDRFKHYKKYQKLELLRNIIQYGLQQIEHNIEQEKTQTYRERRRDNLQSSEE